MSARPVPPRIALSERLARLDVNDVLAAFGGALAVLSFAPWGYAPLAVVSVALLFFTWLEAPPSRAAWRGWLYGVGLFGAGVSWIRISIAQFGAAGVPAAWLVMILFVMMLALFPALAGYLAGRCRARGHALCLLLVWPALFVLSEWARGNLFSGFPWLSLGYGQIEAPLGALAPLGGVWLVSLAVTCSAGLVVHALRARGLPRAVSAAALLVLWIATGFSGRMHWTQPAGPKFSVSLLQGNVPQEVKWLPNRVEVTLGLYLGLTEKAQDSRLIVWPETAIPLWSDQIPAAFDAELRRIARERGADLLIGVPVREGGDAGSGTEPRLYNSMMSVSAEGATAYYHKRHLVPFGEVFPWRDVFGPVYDAIAGPRSGFTAGDAAQPLLHAAGHPAGISICYEDAFGDEVREALPDAAYLVNASNDAWFGDSLAPHQHLEIARMRARETGRYLLRATNTGVSAIIGPRGEFVASSPQFETDVLTAEILPMQGATPYVRLGEAWMLVLLAVVAIPFLRGRITPTP